MDRKKLLVAVVAGLVVAMIFALGAYISSQPPTQGSLFIILEAQSWQYVEVTPSYIIYDIGKTTTASFTVKNVANVSVSISIAPEGGEIHVDPDKIPVLNPQQTKLILVMIIDYENVVSSYTITVTASPITILGGLEGLEGL